MRIMYVSRKKIRRKDPMKDSYEFKDQGKVGGAHVSHKIIFRSKNLPTEKVELKILE
jgi:hypothetical protein